MRVAQGQRGGWRRREDISAPSFHWHSFYSFIECSSFKAHDSTVISIFTELRQHHHHLISACVHLPPEELRTHPFSFPLSLTPTPVFPLSLWFTYSGYFDKWNHLICDLFSRASLTEHGAPEVPCVLARQHLSSPAVVWAPTLFISTVDGYSGCFHFFGFCE